MAEPSKLRHYAVKCLERAEGVRDQETRNAWLEAAANWLQIAGTKERTLTGQQQQQQFQPHTEKG